MNIFGEIKPSIVPLNISENQFDFYDKVARGFDYSFLFESLTGPEELAETSVMGFNPQTIVKVFYDKIKIVQNKIEKEIITNEPFIEIKKLLRKVNDQSYRYLGGAVGIVNYDAIQFWERIPKRHKIEEPLMEFGIYDDGILYDNKQNKFFYFYYNDNRINEFKVKENHNKFSVSEITPNLNKDEFIKIVQKAKEYIHDGDVFQVVLSRKFNFNANGDFLKVYKVLRKLNPSPYLYYLKHGKKTIIGASPEMLIRVSKDIVETFPIAGTRKITHDEKKNELLKQELLNDQKEIAEHTMLVDLGRNDIGRVCEFGSVKVKELMKIKKFSHVQHMVTHVIGKLDSKKDMFDAFKAVFPAGTVTGAPKIRAMEIIEELEPESRGSYAGAVGYFSYNGCCDFAIAIRSIFIDKNRGFIQAGAGIVTDSVPENEFKETEHKAGAMIQALKEAAK